MELITIIEITLLSWLITHFEPLSMFLLTRSTDNFILQKLIYIMTCWKCNSLWLGFSFCFILNHNLFNAIASSFIAWLIEKIIK